MTTQYSGVHGTWRRFTDYRISERLMPKNVPPRFRDHFRYIRPAPNAKLETYSCIMGVPSDDAGNSQFVAYENIQSLDLDDENAILDWCRKFGLLGILPQRATLIRLAPRWRPIGDSTDPCLFKTQTSYSRVGVGWNQIVKSAWGSEEITIDEEHRMEDWIGQLVTVEETVHPPPSAILSELFVTRYEETTLGDAIARYFPDVPNNEQDTHEYPIPLSNEFWYQYGESLGEFRDAVSQFQNMVEALGKNEGPLDYLPTKDLHDLISAQGSLHSLASVSPVLGNDANGQNIPRWAFLSLLGIFAFSVWQELVGGKSVYQCARPKCRKVFLSSNTRRQYCSDRCRQTEEKARQRIRAKSPDTT